MAPTTPPLMLVIDDEAAIRQSLTMHFKFRGLRVEAAATGGEGLERLQRGDIDVVLTDIGLPDMTGHEVVKTAITELAKLSDQPPEFVVMTANATLDNAIASLREGACQFVTKPLSMAFLETVVNRALELRELRRKVRRLEVEHEAFVLQSVEAATSNLTLVATLEAVLRAVVLLHQPNRAAIWLVDHASGEIRPVSVRLGEDNQPLSEAHQATAEAAIESGGQIFRAAGDVFLTVAAIPGDDGPEGAISMEHHGDTDMLAEADSAGVLAALAEHAARAIKKDRLFANLRQSAMQISSLFEVGLAMSSEVSLQNLFDVIVDSASRVCGAERCSLMLIEPGGETMRIRAARGIDEAVIAEAEAVVGEGIAGTVAATGEPLFISDIETDSQFGRRNADQYTSTSLVSVPILVNNRVVGVLNVNNKHGGESFTENDFNLMTLLASQAAVAIDNAHRYQDLSEQAITDGLTGVYVRRSFDEFLERAFRAAKTTGRGFAVLMCDIDHFKAVNDTHGHQAGDQALRMVASWLRQAVRDDDVVTRYGGEEFAVILARTEAAAAVQVAERVRACVEEHEVEHNGQSFGLTISIGVAAFDDVLETPEELVAIADRALYQAKENGRNQVVLGAPDSDN